MPTSRQLAAWAPVVAWAALIFALSSIPSLSTGLGTWDTILRKGAHVVEYAILGALLLRAWGRELPSFLAGVAYAGSDVFHPPNVRLLRIAHGVNPKLADVMLRRLMDRSAAP